MKWTGMPETDLDFIMGEYLGFLDYDDIFYKDALKKNYTI